MNADTRIGGLVDLRVGMANPTPGASLRPLLLRTVGPFEVVRAVPKVRGRSDSSGGWNVTLTAFQDGALLVPALPFAYRRSPGSPEVRVETAPIWIVLSAPKVDTNGGLRPLRVRLPSLTVALTVQWLMVVAFGVLLLLVFTWWRLARRSRLRSPGRSQSRQRLHQLARRVPMTEEERREFYTKLSAIIRQEITRQVSLHVETMTSPQLLQILATRPLSQAGGFEEVQRLLWLVDSMKYAKPQPTVRDHTEPVNAALKLLIALAR